MADTDFVPSKFTIDVTDYLWILRRRIILVLVIFVAVFAGVLGLTSLEQSLFQSSCLIKISSRQPLATISGTSINYFGMGSGGLTSELELINHDKELITATLDKLKAIYREGEVSVSEEERAYVENMGVGTIKGLISAFQRSRGDLVTIQVNGLYPTFTQHAANTLAHVYRMDFAAAQTSEALEAKTFIDEQSAEIKAILAKNSQEIGTFSSRLAQKGSSAVYEEELARLKIELSHAKERYTDAHPRVQKIVNQIQKIAAEIGETPRDRQTFEELVHNQKILQGMLKHLQELAIKADMDYKTKKTKALEDIQIMESAGYGFDLTRGGKNMNIVIGAIFAILVSVVCAFVWEGLDTSIGKIEDVERITMLPVIAQIPVLGSSPHRKLLRFFGRRKPITRDLDMKVLFNFDGKSVAAEAYRTLRTNIQFAIINDQDKVIALTSSSPLEGKTLTATNLAIALAQTGKSIILVEADLRRPQMAALFKIDTKPGLSDLLIGSAEQDDCIRTAADILLSDSDWDKLVGVQGIDNLNVLPAGSPPPNAAELVASIEFKTLVESLSERYDYVIIDTPPVLPVADASIISSMADATIIIYQSDTTSRHLLLRAIQTLKKNQTKILGVVINQLSYDVTMPKPYKYSTYSYY